MTDKNCRNCKYHYYDTLFGDQDYELCEKEHIIPLNHKSCDDWRRR